MKPRQLLTGGALACACATVLFVYQGHERDELLQRASTTEPLTAQRQEPAPAPKPTPPTLPREARVEVAVPPPMAPGPTAPPPEPASPPREAPVTSPPPPLSTAQLRQRLEDYFGDEPFDPAWARSAEQLATDGVRAALPTAAQLRSIQCRASLCRIETEHGDSEQSLSFVHTAFMNPERQVWNAAFVTVRGEDSTEDRIVTVTYLAREGVELPMERLLSSSNPL
ncbi:hypothetical protein SAMN05443572_111228 [Myxococcus fulvus]|uniref:Lipoprotein n=1 Tax=Myxococcus fulvus TaxID=33 RepID=A0A511TD63_MYXFU|nr:hypothetical protein [Myxococcus fulvus]GEN12107.1 hypothetical protein MFU01_71440 [Myxococcus fulvus]SEU36578.1 hypothetical protein SAMN05443572_111228 [Myxococcus fulvus]